jgi:hypothetical protein
LSPHGLAGIVVLGLAVHRAWRILAVDEMPWLVRARRWFLGLADHPSGVLHVRRPTLKKWLECPWCAGAWLTVVGYVAWRCAPTVAEPAIVMLAASTIVGLVVRNLDPTED